MWIRDNCNGPGETWAWTREAVIVLEEDLDLRNILDAVFRCGG